LTGRHGRSAGRLIRQLLEQRNRFEAAVDFALGLSHLQIARADFKALTGFSFGAMKDVGPLRNTDSSCEAIDVVISAAQSRAHMC
jgi:hypothetical protein